MLDNPHHPVGSHYFNIQEAKQPSQITKNFPVAKRFIKLFFGVLWSFIIVTGCLGSYLAVCRRVTEPGLHSHREEWGDCTEV
jgi:hypothetical protein